MSGCVFVLLVVRCFACLVGWSVFKVWYVCFGEEPLKTLKKCCPAFIISNRLLISESEDQDYRKILEVFKLGNSASQESDLLFSDICEIRAK